MPRLVGPTVLLLLAACGGGEASVALATRVDSAGIAIVTSPAPALPNGGGWSIGTAPLVTIGPRGDDDPHYELLRVNSGTILPSGEVVVLSAGNQEMRFFGPTGEWLRTAGRAGEGPGEFRSPAGLFQSGDTLYVRDGNLGRLNAFALDGSFLTSWSYPTSDEGRPLSLSQRLGDGSWAATSPLVFGGGAQLNEGTTRYPSTYVRVGADLGGVLNPLATTAGSEQSVAVSSGAGGSITSIRVFQPPLARSTPAAAAADQFIWGDNAMPEYRMHDAAGTLETIVRWAAPAVPVNPELIGRIRDALLARAEGDERAQQQIRDQYAIEPLATEVPYFNSLLLDDTGTVWVREYPVFLTDSTRLRVFAPDGQWLTTLVLPPRHTLLQAGSDFLLTVWQDDDDLEYIRIYLLHRGVGNGRDEGLPE